MMRTELRVAGFGGQGVILAGVIVARAAAVHDSLEVAQTQSYGPEARGGACKCDVVIADGRILYPKVKRPQFLLFMSEPALQKYENECEPNALFLVDSTLVTTQPKEERVAMVPATAIAEEELGKRMVANMVMLGALAQVSSVTSLESLCKAVSESVAPKFVDLNLRALRMGYERVRVVS